MSKIKLATHGKNKCVHKSKKRRILKDKLLLNVYGCMYVNTRQMMYTIFKKKNIKWKIERNREEEKTSKGEFFKN